jgi:hypothetical protein
MDNRSAPPPEEAPTALPTACHSPRFTPAPPCSVGPVTALVLRPPRTCGSRRAKHRAGESRKLRVEHVRTARLRRPAPARRATVLSCGLLSTFYSLFRESVDSPSTEYQRASAGLTCSRPFSVPNGVSYREGGVDACGLRQHRGTVRRPRRRAARTGRTHPRSSNASCWRSRVVVDFGDSKCRLDAQSAFPSATPVPCL